MFKTRGWEILNYASIMLAVAGLVLCLLGIATAEASEGDDEAWYSWFWPLGERVEIEHLKDEYVPFQVERGASYNNNNADAEQQEDRAWYSTLFSLGSDQVNQSGLKQDFSPVDVSNETLPPRPNLLVEAGDPFLDVGQLDAGFEVPGLEAVWQPRLWSYFIYRTTVQSFDAGNPGGNRETEFAHRLDLFVNLQLTGTEKILLGLRPLDNNNPNNFTRYTFDGTNEGFNDEFNYTPETLFFEGDLGSLFPVLDRTGIIPIDFGFTVGRQPFTFQEGILINDTLDAVGFIRNNIPVSGFSNFRVSGLYSWNRNNRNDNGRGTEANLFGLFTAADNQTSTYNLDLIYVNDNSNTDGFYFGASAIQRISAWGGASTAFRINGSVALEDEVGNIPGNLGTVVGDGVLLTAEFSKHPHGSNDIMYFNPFLAIGNYTQAGREAVVGGPLANTGILFASPGLGNYLAEINPFTDDDVGAAIGYQAFWDNNRRNLILEIAGKHDYGGNGFDSLGFGAQLQQAIGRHIQLTFEAFYTINEDRDDGAGARGEVQVVY